MVHPNGLAFSPDEDRLYVSDTSAFMVEGGHQHILVFDVVEGTQLAGGASSRSCSQAWRTDSAWMNTVTSGVLPATASTSSMPTVIDLAVIHVPEITSNCVFGGADGRRLFMTASASLYAIDTLVRGAGVAAAVARGEPSS